MPGGYLLDQRLILTAGPEAAFGRTADDGRERLVRSV